MSHNYDELAERAERGELAVKPGSVRHGSAASTEARQLLLEAAGVGSEEELVQLTKGRPDLASKKRRGSPVIRARVPAALKARVLDLAALDDSTESEIVREALAAYVDMRRAS